MMRVVFMGTPDFSVPPLIALHEAGYEITGVFTQPDRPSGRGKKLTKPEAKQAAEKLGIPVYQFERVRRKEGVAAMRTLSPDIIVTAAFGQILPKTILDIPKYGTINVHASLLPKYRGAAPINRCIAAGETVSGVTTMYTDVGLDTGDMIYSLETPIAPDETAGELSQRLSVMGAELIVRTLRDIQAGVAPRTRQDETLASYQPMLTKDDGRINWNIKSVQVLNHVRAMTPWPGAWTQAPHGTIKIWKVRTCEGCAKPGEIISADPKMGLIVACGKGAVEITELQPPGKQRMKASDYLRGLRGDILTKGTRMGNEE